MIWLTWRQFRAQAIAAGVVLAAFAVVFAATGPNLARLYATSGLAACHAPDDCAAATADFLTEMKADAVYPLLYVLGAAFLILAPALIGAFWGAPLVARELEAHTFRLAWNQSVTRARWTAAKIGLVGLAAMACTGLLSTMVTWWAAPIDRSGGFPVGAGRLTRFSPQIFDARGIAPLGYAAFAFALGVSAGVLIRRTLPAMAVTLALFAAVQIIVPTVIRPHLIAPAHTTTAPLSAGILSGFQMNHDGGLTVPVDIPGAWIIANQTITPAGRVFVLPLVPQCQSGTPQQCVGWMAGRDLRQEVTYQPADRFWDFQGYETAIFLALAVMLSGFCVWWVRRGRLT